MFATQNDLNWDVIKRDLFVKVDGEDIKVPGKVAQVRDDINQVIGITSPSYEVFQNSQLRELVAPMVSEGLLEITNIGYLGMGNKVYLQAQMAQDYKVVGEEHRGMLTLLNSHDGSSTLAAGITDTRVICTNTFASAMSSFDHRIRHNSEIHVNALNITETIDYVNDGMRVFAQNAEKLASTPCDVETLDSLISYAFNKDAETVRSRNTIVRFFRNGVGNEGKTLWDGLNGLTQWVSHNSMKNENRRFASANFGKGADVSRRFMKAALATV